MTPIYKSWKDNWPVSQTLVLGKVILNAVTRHMWVKQVIRLSQHRFVKAVFSSSSLITFYGKTTLLVGEGKAVNLVYMALVKPLIPFSTALSWRN